MSFLQATFIFIAVIFGTAILSKVVVYCGTLAYFEARHAFFSRFIPKKKAHSNCP